MQRQQTFAAASVAVGLLFYAVGCSQPTSSQSANAAAPAPAASVDRVTAGQPQRKSLALSTSQPGRIEAFEETPLFPKVTGYVEKVLVDIGDSVAKDQLLVTISVPELQDDLDQKEALVAQADAEVKQAEAAIHAAEAAAETAAAKVSQAEAGIGRADGEHERWKAEHARMKQLADNGSVTQKLVDETLNQFRAAAASRQEAAANVQSAKAALNEAQANVRKAQADHVAAEARQRVALANLARAKTLLGYTQIKAPFDGVVTRRSIDTGHYVHPATGGTTRPLVVVARTDMVRIFVDIPELEAPLVDGGDNPDAAVVRVQSLRDREFDAKVTRTAWSLDASNRSLRTEIDVPNADGLLRPGMYASVTILLDQRENVIALPTAAIVREGRNTFCCSVVAGRIERRPIQLGLRSGDEVEIVSGLDGSETVVLTRADSLRPAQPVEVIAPAEG